jgi:hypothetical protein
MQNILKNIKSFICKSFFVASVGFGCYLFGSYQSQEHINDLAYALEEERTTLSDFEVEIYLNAQALLGELGGAHRAEWVEVQSAIFNRVTDPRWPMSIDEVLLERRPNGTGCMIDAMCDRVMENLLTDIGQEARMYAATMLSQFSAGTFVPTHSGHSWATETAADGHAYFEGLCAVVQDAGHNYFDDCRLAPITSLRPIARPNQNTDRAILTAIAIAMND